MPKKIAWLLLALLVLDGCAGRRAEVLRGSRRRFPISDFWNVYAAAQNLLQREGFVVNLSQQSRGILVATMVKGGKKDKVIDRIASQTGSSFRDGDQLHVMVSVGVLPKNAGAEMRLSVLRERDNEWMQEDGDEIGNAGFYGEFFSKVAKTVGKNNSPTSSDAGYPQTY